MADINKTNDNLSLSDEKVKNFQPTQTVQQKQNKEDVHMDWGQSFGTKSGSGSFIGTDPNQFYLKNLQFLSGQNSAASKENIKKPIFRLAFLLDSGKDSLAKSIHVTNSTNPSELENVPSDYYNILLSNNLDNASVFFLDFCFEWSVDEDGHNWLKPVWINFEKPNPFVLTNAGTIKMHEVKTLQSFHLRPFKKPKNGIIYGNNNPFCKDFWRKIISSFEMSPSAQEVYSGVYTIWFQKKYFGYNVLEKVFQDSFYDQVQYFKDSCLNKKILDLFELSDLISKNDKIEKHNDIFLLFTKWLNYKNTSMTSTTDIYNKKSFESMKTEKITINYFKRLDDFFYYSVKVFFNILDQCLYENSINQIGANGILLEDFFKKDYAVGGTNQESDQEMMQFEDEHKQQTELSQSTDVQQTSTPSTDPASAPAEDSVQQTPKSTKKRTSVKTKRTRTKTTSADKKTKRTSTKRRK